MMGFMGRRMLDERSDALLKEERRLLADLRLALGRSSSTLDDLKRLDEAIRQLDELFLLVVVGEFNSGKSTFINALLGTELLAADVTPTTTEVAIIRYGEEQRQGFMESRLEFIEAPVEALREINIVDTPGTNAVIREHQEITEDFIPRSDLVLFITSADRPYTESERLFLEGIRRWGKKVVLVVNKVDILAGPEKVSQVCDYVAENAKKSLGEEPEVFAVSASLALRARLAEQIPSPEWDASGFDGLERHVSETLDEKGRIRLKLLNPLGVGLRLGEERIEGVKGRQSLLGGDMETIGSIEGKVNVYQEDMRREFRYRLSEVERLLLDMEKRGLNFFDQTLRLGNVLGLLDKEEIEREFERAVVSDTPHLIEEEVTSMIDWMVSSELNQWQIIRRSLDERRAAHSEADGAIGQVGDFRYDRDRYLASVGEAAQKVIKGYDRQAEAAQIAESAQVAVASAGGVVVGAAGIATIIAMIATTAMWDITGVLMGIGLGVLGLLIIPSSRARAKDELRKRVAELRERLIGALSDQFESEMHRGISRIEEAIAPYSRFVRSEWDRLEARRGELAALHEELARLKREIEAAL